MGSGERFGSDADEPLDTAGAFSDEEDGDEQDNDGDDEWEDVEVRGVMRRCRLQTIQHPTSGMASGQQRVQSSEIRDIP